MPQAPMYKGFEACYVNRLIVFLQKPFSIPWLFVGKVVSLQSNRNAMYTIYKRDSYRLCVCSGIVNIIIWSVALYFSNEWESSWDFSVIFLLIAIIFTLFYLIKYFRKSLNYLALRIDETGIFLAAKKDEDVFIPWEKIKFVIFALDEGLHNDTKIAIRQFSNEMHYFPFLEYYLCFKPRKAIKAAYKYADNVKKVRVVKRSDFVKYELNWKCDEVLME